MGENVTRLYSENVVQVAIYNTHTGHKTMGTSHELHSSDESHSYQRHGRKTKGKSHPEHNCSDNSLEDLVDYETDTNYVGEEEAMPSNPVAKVWLSPEIVKHMGS